MEPKIIAWALKRALEDLNSARSCILHDPENLDRIRSRIEDAEDEINIALSAALDKTAAERKAMQDDNKKPLSELKEEEAKPKEPIKQPFQIVDITDQLPKGFGVIMSVDDVESKDREKGQE